MAKDRLFSDLKTFFINKSAPKEALKVLPAETEIEINIFDSDQEETWHITITCGQDTLRVEEKEATNHDWSFAARTETIFYLIETCPDSVPQIGLALFKEILSGRITPTLHSPPMTLLTKGYLKVLLEGGKPIARIATEKGILGLMKIANRFSKT